MLINIELTIAIVKTVLQHCWQYKTVACMYISTAYNVGKTSEV